MSDNGEMWQHFDQHHATLEIIQSMYLLAMDLIVHGSGDTCLMHSAIKDRWCETCKVRICISCSANHHEEYFHKHTLKEKLELWMKLKAVLCDGCQKEVVRHGVIIDFDRLILEEDQRQENSEKLEDTLGGKWQMDGSDLCGGEQAMEPNLSDPQTIKTPGLTEPQDWRNCLRGHFENVGFELDVQVPTNFINSSISNELQIETEGACALATGSDCFEENNYFSHQYTYNEHQSRKVDPQIETEGACALATGSDCFEDNNYFSHQDTYNEHQSRKVDPQIETEGACALATGSDCFEDNNYFSHQDTYNEQSRKVDPQIEAEEACALATGSDGVEDTTQIAPGKSNVPTNNWRDFDDDGMTLPNSFNRTVVPKVHQDHKPFDPNQRKMRSFPPWRAQDNDSNETNKFWRKERKINNDAEPTYATRHSNNQKSPNNIRSIKPLRDQGADRWIIDYPKDMQTANQQGEKQEPTDQNRHRRMMIIFPAINKMESNIRSFHLYPDNYMRKYDPPKWQTSATPNVYFLDFSVDNRKIGRVLVETNPDCAPVMSANFATLCVGMDISVPNLTYKGCKVFNCTKGKYLITGDNQHNDGTGGKSIVFYRHTYRENTGLEVARGSVAMLYRDRRGVRKFSSQFKIIVNDTPEGDEAVFARVVSGHDVVENIVALGNEEGKPSKSVLISNCGKHC